MSYIDLGIEETSETSFYSRGNVRLFDIKSGEVDQLVLCRRPRKLDRDGQPYAWSVNGGGPFDVCSEAAEEAFATVVNQWASQAIPATQRTDPPDIPRLQQGGACPGEIRAAMGDPVVIPYRALKRFMPPGPLGDELLKLP